jgi:hypothetical protein
LNEQQLKLLHDKTWLHFVSVFLNNKKAKMIEIQLRNDVIAKSHSQQEKAREILVLF